MASRVRGPRHRSKQRGVQMHSCAQPPHSRLSLRHPPMRVLSPVSTQNLQAPYPGQKVTNFLYQGRACAYRNVASEKDVIPKLC